MARVRQRMRQCSLKGHVIPLPPFLPVCSTSFPSQEKRKWEPEAGTASDAPGPAPWQARSGWYAKKPNRGGRGRGNGRR